MQGNIAEVVIGMSNRTILKEGELSIAQNALWFIHQCYPDVGIYNIEFSWCIPEHVDIACLQDSIDFLTQRHEMLRSTFPVKDGVPIRRVWSEWNIPIEEVEVGSVDNETLSKEFVDPEVRKSLDITAIPPRRFILFHRSGYPNVLTLIMNHVVIDLASMMLWTNELRVVYGALTRGLEPTLDDLTLSYEDYIDFQKSYLESDIGKRDEVYWLDRLSQGYQGLNLPTDYPKRTPRDFHTGYLHGAFPKRLSDQMLDLASEIKVSPYEMFLACYFLLLHKYTGQTSIAIGTPTAGRKPEQYGLYGYFVNPIMVRVKIAQDTTVSELIQAVRAAVVSGLSNQAFV